MAAWTAGGTTRAYDGEAVYWLPEQSSGALNREVFTSIDARSSRVRVDADCHEDEIEYVVSKIREHQISASAASTSN